ncbi:TetR/AcrR family transcriptional regulator [Nocardia fluminea]|uniref:TetR/AcrR family transcriptional regulator n=1 Tax=Nocardia fluminea TaxID=134984 RepID=UPI0036697F03
MPTNEGSRAKPSRRASVRPRRDRRQALIDAAIEVFGEAGDDADISAASISKRAGVAHGLLFYYFTDKQGLVAAALADILGKLATFQSPRPEETTARARIEGFVRRHIEFLDRYRTAYVKVMREGALADPEIERAVREARAHGVLQVAQLAGLPTQMNTLTRAAVTGWVGFLDRLADEYFDDSDLDLNSTVALAADAFTAVVEAAARQR